MKYELAKELKDADFPIAGGIYHSFDKEKYIYPTPTLSELIEACGGDFDHLKNNIHEWKAVSIRLDFGRGTNPEEAVAKLYLALHKK